MKERVNENSETKNHKEKKQISNDLINYLKSIHALWFWFTFSIAVIYPIIIFCIPPVQPAVIIRQILTIVQFFWLPGHILVKIVFPKRTQELQSKGNLEPLERFALSIGISVVLIPVIGLFLNYTPSGITLTPTLLGLMAVILSLSLVALAREYQIQTPKT